MKHISETFDTFYQERSPLSDRNFDTSSILAEIQDHLAQLSRKKSELKELKLMEKNYKAKGNEQQSRIENINIEIDHLISLEENGQIKIQKLSKEVQWHQQQIKMIAQEAQSIKGEIDPLFSNISKVQVAIREIKRNAEQKNFQINQKDEQKYFKEEDVKRIDQLIHRNENKIREKVEVLKKLRIQETELEPILKFLEEQIMNTIKKRNSTIFQNKGFDEQIYTRETRLCCFQRETQTSQWDCNQIQKSNQEIECLNIKLEQDLESVQKHLSAVEKTNKVLQDSLSEYELTGNKLNKLINPQGNSE